MINTIAELLNAFKDAEKEVLDAYDMGDTYTIGTMYEGLTENILNQSIFHGLDLRVIKNSFIKGSHTEYDVMLVEGDGEPIPYSTGRYKYEPEKVIIVIQVKKNLYSSGLEGGYNNLKYIVQQYDFQPEPHIHRMVSHGLRAICRKDIEALKLKEFSEEDKAIFDTLKIEASLPIRIIWGYNGFVNEYNFRKSFMEFLSQNITTDPANIIGGFGPHNFPNLIMCGKYSIIKLNGMPFGKPIDDDKWWLILGSSPYNPMHFFLELVWTRLTYKYGISSDIFGEDLHSEPIAPLLSCKITKLENHEGWNYNEHIMDQDDLLADPPIGKWEPVELNMTQFVIFKEIIEKGFVFIDKELEDYVTHKGVYTNTSEFIEKLLNTGLVWKSEDKLKPLTEGAQCAFLPDGRIVAGENNSGRLTNWVNQQIENKSN